MMKIKTRKDKNGNIWVGKVRFTKGGFIALAGVIAVPIYFLIGVLFGWIKDLTTLPIIDALVAGPGILERIN